MSENNMSTAAFMELWKETPKPTREELVEIAKDEMPENCKSGLAYIKGVFTGQY